MDLFRGHRRGLCGLFSLPTSLKGGIVLPLSVPPPPYASKHRLYFPIIVEFDIYLFLQVRPKFRFDVIRPFKNTVTMIGVSFNGKLISGRLLDSYGLEQYL